MFYSFRTVLEEYIVEHTCIIHCLKIKWIIFSWHFFIGCNTLTENEDILMFKLKIFFLIVVKYNYIQFLGS